MFYWVLGISFEKKYILYNFLFPFSASLYQRVSHHITLTIPFTFNYNHSLPNTHPLSLQNTIIEQPLWKKVPTPNSLQNKILCSLLRFDKIPICLVLNSLFLKLQLFSSYITLPLYDLVFVFVKIHEVLLIFSKVLYKSFS